MKIMSGPKAYFRNDVMSSRCMETGGTGYRLHQSMSWNHILNKPVLRCIEIVLSCLEADRSKRLSIGDICR